MSYSGDPRSSPKDAVRFLIKDHGAVEIFTDNEIVFLLETEGNYWLAAAVLCEKLTTIASSGGLASKSIGGLSETYSQGSIAFYESQAKMYRQRGLSKAVPTLGDVNMPQIFSLGQMDSPGVRDPNQGMERGLQDDP